MQRSPHAPAWRWLLTALLALLAAPIALAAPPLPQGQVVETAEEDFEALVARGSARFEARDYPAALEAFTRAYALRPVPNLLYNMARIHEALGQFPQAIDHYTRFIAAPDVTIEARQDAITRLKTLSEVVALTGAQPAASAAGLIDLNTASAAELETLPGIGPTKAQAIIDHRTQNGPFRSVDALQDVHGIGPATVNKIRPMATATAGAAPAPANPPPGPDPEAPPTPDDGVIDINTASAEQLQRLPGIGPSKARSIVDERTQNGPFTSCKDLTRVRGIGPSTVETLLPVCSASAIAEGQ